jgi:hypothetical protein
MWQSTLDNFILRLQSIFKNYEDITSPIISALQNISFGVRQVVSFTLSFLEESVMTKSSDSLQVLEHSAQSLFSLPCTVHFPLHSNNCVESLNRYLLQSVDDIQHSVQTLSDRTSRRLGVSNRGGPRENLSTVFARCLVLSKVDYLLSSEITQLHHLSSIQLSLIVFITSSPRIVESLKRRQRSN